MHISESLVDGVAVIQPAVATRLYGCWTGRSSDWVSLPSLFIDQFMQATVGRLIRAALERWELHTVVKREPVQCDGGGCPMQAEFCHVLVFTGGVKW